MPVPANLLATAEGFGGSQRACLAMMMQLLGATTPKGHCPDLKHVQAFARHDPLNESDRSDLRTLLGAAVSFSDSSSIVSFVGPSSAGPHFSNEQMEQWGDTLDSRQNCSADFRPPTVEDMERVFEDSQSGWIAMLGIADTAFPKVYPTMQPCLVMGMESDKLIVHNPAARDPRPEVFQYIDLAEALGGAAVSLPAGTTLLAVRNSPITAQGITIHPLNPGPN